MIAVGNFEGRLSDMPEAEALFAAVLDATADAVMVTDRAGMICRINTAFHRLTGFGAEALVGRDARDLFRDINSLEFCDELWAEETEARFYPSVRSKHADGRAQLHALNMTPIRDGSGQASRFVAVILSESFQSAEQTSDGTWMASGAAYEIATPGTLQYLGASDDFSEGIDESELGSFEFDCFDLAL